MSSDGKQLNIHGRGRPFKMHDPLLDSLADGVFSVDLDWRITSFNRAAEEITGIPREEAVGQICCEVFKASICEQACALRETLKTNQPIIDRKIFIFTIQGKKLPVSISTAILRDEHGKIIGGVETFRDLSQVETLRKELQKRYSFADIISRSPQMTGLFELIPQVADSDVTVLITGESGTGKELVARALHDLSSRKKEPFIAVNCGALPDTLLESELFGYKKGAFTDARTDKPGRFALAGKGTVFLDEVGELSTNLQVKLLRVIEEKRFEPLGGIQPEPVLARLVAATNQNLDTMVKNGTFREDLYYRINVINLELPPLRERMEDIPLLVDHFIQRFNHLQHASIRDMSSDAMAALMQYDFPGNIRELLNFIERAFVLCREGSIGLEHLPAQFRAAQDKFDDSKGKSLADLEKAAIRRALVNHAGNQVKAAAELGIHRTTLYRKMQHYGINLPG
jgi:PAS domain S-box-containing protein